MIIVCCREETYRYNAFHMVKAFFPHEEVLSQLDERQEELVTVWRKDAADVAADVVSDCKGRHIIAAVTTAGSKNDAERKLYRQIFRLTGEDLPWGILMGVRPTKPAMTAVNAGISRQDFIRKFHEEKLVNEDKASLAWDIASREKNIIDIIERKMCSSGTDAGSEYHSESGSGSKSGTLNIADTFSLYIGIPFCPSICSYCSFSAGTISTWAGLIDDYLDALCGEIELTAEKLSSGLIQNMQPYAGGTLRLYPRPISVYIGGGTPTSLNKAQLERLFLCLHDNFQPETTFEYTLEAGRPDSITETKLRIAKEYGVTRISINPQSMQQKTLDAVGRGHTVSQVYEAFSMARAEGFDNINMDLIAGLPGEGCDEMDDTLSQIRTLAPDSLTVHALAIKRTSKMASQCVDGRTVADMITMARQAAFAMGLSPYYLYRQKSIAGNLENTGYARHGCEGIYNILMMEEVQSIIGCGAGTRTKIILPEPVKDPKRGGDHLTNILHYSDPKAPDAYIRKFI